MNQITVELQLGTLKMFLVLLSTLAITCASGWNFALKNPEWKEGEIAEPGMLVGSGRVKRYIELGDKDTSLEPVVCDLPDGKPGFCKPMQHCVQEDLKDNFKEFASRLCILKNSKVGTCCRDTSQEFGSLALAGDLPATASKEEKTDVLTTIARAENRGCGFSTRPRDQIGSGPVKTHEWPWMASVTITGIKHFCGGVLITDRHVLTAAHCFTKYEASVLEVRLGEYDFKSKTESRLYVFKVAEKIEHAEYDHMSHMNDIALLKLQLPALFNTYVWPICLPPVGLELSVNETTVLIGWGTVSFGGPTSPVLQEVAMPIWEHQKCVDSFTDQVFDENYCVGSYSGGKDACQYDSGSPLMYEMPSGRWAAIGLVSWGVRCGEPNHPGLYTRVDKYLPWIAANTQF